MTDDVLSAALAYAAAGWAVFPVRGKLPALDLAPHWSADSTVDPQQIVAWYAGSSGLGVAVDLAKSGLAVVDGDNLRLLHFADRLAGWAWHGDRTRQSWLYTINGRPIPQARHPWGDVKSAGGYVVMPPSPHPSGVAYEWVDTPGDWPPVIPDDIADLIAPPAVTDPPADTWDGQAATPAQLEQAAATLRRQADRVAATTTGDRNRALNQAALICGHYAPHYLAPKAVTDALTWAARECGLERDDGTAQCAATIRSGLRAGMAEPQQISGPVLLDQPGTPGFNLDDLTPRVRELVLDMLRRDEAKRVVADILAAHNPPQPVDAGTLAQILARDPEPPPRVEGLLPAGGRLLLAATRKTGKTTWLLNLAFALLTGRPFLGALAVRPLTGSVALLNYEVSAHQAARWAQEAGIPPSRLLLVNMRGRRNLLATEQGRAELVELLKAHSVELLMVDPFGRAYTGKSQNDAGEVGPWLVNLDTVAVDADCTELILATHAGWNGEHSRGSSALEDWPDCLVWLTRDAETESRFMRAEGRDVLIEEDQLHFNHLGRRLTFSGNGSRVASAATRRLDQLVDALVRVVTAQPGIGVRGIKAVWREEGFDFSNGEEGKASAEAQERGLVVVRTGLRNVKGHYLAPLPGVSERSERSGTVPTVPEQSETPVFRVPSAPRGAERGTPEHSQGVSGGANLRTLKCRACGFPLDQDFYGDQLHPTCSLDIR